MFMCRTCLQNTGRPRPRGAPAPAALSYSCICRNSFSQQGEDLAGCCAQGEDFVRIGMEQMGGGLPSDACAAMHRHAQRSDLRQLMPLCGHCGAANLYRKSCTDETGSMSLVCAPHQAAVAAEVKFQESCRHATSNSPLVCAPLQADVAVETSVDHCAVGGAHVVAQRCDLETRNIQALVSREDAGPSGRVTAIDGPACVFLDGHSEIMPPKVPSGNMADVMMDVTRRCLDRSDSRRQCSKAATQQTNVVDAQPARPAPAPSLLGSHRIILREWRLVPVPAEGQLQLLPPFWWRHPAADQQSC